jgi:hypothetical protein
VADLSDVEAALVSAVTAAVYPSGLSMPSVTASKLRIYRGWPMSGALEADLAGGIVNIAVFPVPGATRNTTRWGPVVTVTPGVATLTVAVNGASATFAGSGGAGQLAGLLVGGQPYVYVGQAGDTAVVAAAVLAQSIQAVRPCLLSGSTVTVPGVTSLVARVAAYASSNTEWSRQEQGFRISVWCPNPGLRDLVCGVVGSALAATSFLTLTDGSGGRVRYRSSSSIDDDQDAQAYRRDLVYDIEYGTSVANVVPSMLFGDLVMNGNGIYG